MLYISAAVVLALEDATSLTYPIFLWNNLITLAGITADEEDDDFPATNLANPQTSSVWKSGSTADQYLTFEVTSDEPIDCVGIARHNFGSGSIPLTIEGITDEPGAVWTELGEFAPGDDAPILALFEGDYYTSIRILLEPDAVEPQAAVIYIGTALQLVKGLAPGFTPPVDGLQTSKVVGIAENGDFLGDIITSQRRVSSLTLRPMTGTWYRAHMREFLHSADPFFFAWAPELYALETDYAKFNGDPQAVINRANGSYDVSFQITALGL